MNEPQPNMIQPSESPMHRSAGWPRMLKVTAAGIIATLTVFASVFVVEKAIVLKTAAIRPPNSPKFSQLIRAAHGEISKGQISPALTYLKVAVSMQPHSALARTELGVALILAGAYGPAEDQLKMARMWGASDESTLDPLFAAMSARGENQQLLDLFPAPAESNRGPTAATILRARAKALQAMGNAAEALSSIQRSLAIRRDFDGVLAEARIYFLQGQLAQADSLADEALQLRPSDSDAVVLKADIALKRQDSAKAIALIDQLVAEKPNSLMARLARINTYLAVGNTQQAKPDVDFVLGLSPGLPIALYYRATILARERNFAGAWGLAQTLSPELVQSQPEIAVNVADMATHAGFLDAAIAILGKAVSNFPDELDARLKLAVLQLRQKSPLHALNTLAAIEDSKDPRVLVLFALAHSQAGHRDVAQTYINRAMRADGGEQLLLFSRELALKTFTDWLKRNPDDSRVRGQYAITLLRSGDLRSAKAQYEKLVRVPRPDALSLNNLAWLVQKDDPRRALSLAQGAVRLSPGSADFWDTLGWIQLKQSDRKGALSSLERAHQLKPGDPQISYHLALALDANGSRGAAKALLQAATAEGGFVDLEHAKQLLATWQ